MALKQKGAEAPADAKKRRRVGFTQIAADAPPPSRRSRIRRRIRSYLHRSSSDPQPLKPLAAEDFVGIARIEIISAEMKFKDRWLACLSLGERTYRTAISAVLRVLAREISALPSVSDAREVLVGMFWDRFLRKGSLSMVIRELGHMGLPDRALQTLCWAQTHRPHLFPDDRSLASAVEVLARSGKLKAECQLEEYVNSASRTVVEAMARGFIPAGHLHCTRKLLLIVKNSKQMLDASIHVKLIHEAAKAPDGYRLASALLDELAEREESELLKLNPQDCTMLMKVCIKLGRFEAVENLFRWYKASRREVSIVMYTTVLHGRYRGGEYREGMVLLAIPEDGESSRKEQALGRSLHRLRTLSSSSVRVLCSMGEAATTPLLSWMKRSESGEKDLRCSCCSVGLESGFLEILEPSWGAIEINPIGNFAAKGLDCAANCSPEGEIGVRMVSEGVDDGGELSDCAAHSTPEREIEFLMVSEGADKGFDLEPEGEFEIHIVSEGVGDCCNLDLKREFVVKMVDDACLQVFDNSFDGDEGRLVPVELIDSATVAAGNTVKLVREDDAELVKPLIDLWT